MTSNRLISQRKNTHDGVDDVLCFNDDDHEVDDDDDDEYEEAEDNDDDDEDDNVIEPV